MLAYAGSSGLISAALCLRIPPNSLTISCPPSLVSTIRAWLKSSPLASVWGGSLRLVGSH